MKENISNLYLFCILKEIKIISREKKVELQLKCRVHIWLILLCSGKCGMKSICWA